MLCNAISPQLAKVLNLRDWQPVERESIERLALVSDFAMDVLLQQPELASQLHTALEQLNIIDCLESDWPRLIRRWRQAQSLKLIWRDIADIDTVEQTLQGSTWIAEQALSKSYDALLRAMQNVHGVVRDDYGIEQHMVVLGLGKLGGSELNFSSDVDLVYAFTGHGNSDGLRSIPAETFFTRLGQRLANLLDEVTADGFSHRVDLRLRPFGASGRLLLSFNAMEQYFQNSGRDWERYAWLKARPVAGNIEAGFRLLDTLKPFVYRRYLDFTAIDGLRDMKNKIAAEVLRRDIVNDLKLGQGGIREIEFFVQAMQIIYGGRSKLLQLKGLLPSLHQLQAEALISAQIHTELEQAYLFLRKLENRVQMFSDAQVHHLPEATPNMQRIALGLGFADFQQLLAALNSHRSNVQRLFSGLLNESSENAVDDNEQKNTANFSVLSLMQQGFQYFEQHAERLQALQDSSSVAALADRSQQRLVRVMQGFLSYCSDAKYPDQCLSLAISFMQGILRRSSYIALLDEQRSALARVVQVFDESQWLSQLLIDYPLLLDELLDSRVINQQIETLDLNEQLADVLSHHNDDTEMTLLALNEFKISYTFKIAYQFLFHALPANQVSYLLTRLAESILQYCNRLASQELQRQHGIIAGASFAIIGYGSLGARSLAFNSDLDLVFLNQTADKQISDGQRSIESARFFLRHAQKLISLLGLSTSSGSLYEVDIRLRPDGAKGLLVSTMESFEQYQQQRAWVWEMQALVRARAVAGDETLCRYFEQTRYALITTAYEKLGLLQEITTMRQRMRIELDRSSESLYDLKHGLGGLTDIEFFLQAQILLHANQHPELAIEREAPAIIDCLKNAGIIDPQQAQTISYAYEYLLNLSLRCHLNNAPRVLARSALLESVSVQVIAVLAQHQCAAD